MRHLSARAVALAPLRRTPARRIALVVLAGGAATIGFLLLMLLGLAPQQAGAQASVPCYAGGGTLTLQITGPAASGDTLSVSTSGNDYALSFDGSSPCSEAFALTTDPTVQVVDPGSPAVPVRRRGRES